MPPIAFITGITGQDGSYLAELLLSKGYTVHGMLRRTSSFNRSRLDPFYLKQSIENQRLFLHYADLNDILTLSNLIHKIKPDEFYHLAGQSHSGLSYQIPISTFNEIAAATSNLLEIFRTMTPAPKIYHASSAEIFGNALKSPQNETTPFRPISPYGCSKAFCTQLCQVYRRTYNLFICNGILYNHESPRRGENFVTRKISLGVAKILRGNANSLSLGNLDATRDWGHAKDYVLAMWMMLQRNTPDDFVIATGKLHTVRDFVDRAFKTVGLDYHQYITQDPRFFRPNDDSITVGDATKAKDYLGWTPYYSFESLVDEMVHADIQLKESPTFH